MQKCKKEMGGVGVMLQAGNTPVEGSIKS